MIASATKAAVKTSSFTETLVDWGIKNPNMANYAAGSAVGAVVGGIGGAIRDDSTFFKGVGIGALVGAGMSGGLHGSSKLGQSLYKSGKISDETAMGWGPTIGIASGSVAGGVATYAGLQGMFG